MKIFLRQLRSCIMMGVIIPFFSDDALPTDNKKGEKRIYVLLDYNNSYETRVYEPECWISTTIREEMGRDMK